MKKLGGIYGDSFKKQDDDKSSDADKLRALNERRDQNRQLKMAQFKVMEMKKEVEKLRRRLREAEQENRRLETIISKKTS